MSRQDSRDWGALIREQLSSGESQASFCKRRGISVASFQYHKSKGTYAREADVQRFVPIVGKDAEDRIELEVGSNVRMYFPADTSSQRLSELVRCLSSK